MAGTIFTLAGGKGGVGKTTVTGNVATALSGAGHDVVAVDVDLGMTNLGQFMDEPADCGVHQVLAGEAAVEEVTVGSKHGPTIVPGSANLDAIEDADPSNLRQVVDPLADRHEIVLLDTGAGLSHENCVAYGLADAVVLVSTPKAISVQDIQKTHEMVDRVDGTVAGAVLTRSQGELTQQDLSEAAEMDLFGVVPEYGDTEEPVVALNPDSEAAAEYERIATAFAVYHRTGSRTEAISTPEADDDGHAVTDTESSGLFDRVASAFRRD